MAEREGHQEGPAIGSGAGPTGIVLSNFTITIDTRERYPFKSTKQQAATERTKLPVGD